MRTICKMIAVGTVLATLLSGAANAQEAQKRRPAQQAAEPNAIVPAQRLLDRLELTAEQKDKVDKLQREFLEKNKDAVARFKEETKRNEEALKKAKEDKDRAAYRTATEKITDLNKEVARLRGTLEEEIQKVLTADQKKRFTEQKPTRPADGRRPGAAAGELRAVVPAEGLLEKLTLSTEQKDKSAKLQREFVEKNQKALAGYKDDVAKIQEAFKKAREDKDRAGLKSASEKQTELNKSMQQLRDDFDSQFVKLLTADQKKQYEELRKNPAPKRRPGAARTRTQATLLVARPFRN